MISRKPLPKIEILPGAVCLQRVRCGKPNCHCARGQGHPAFYRFWRQDGRLHKQYVRRADLQATRAACRRHHDTTVEARAVIRRAEQMLQLYAAHLRKVEQDAEGRRKEIK